MECYGMEYEDQISHQFWKSPNYFELLKYFNSLYDCKKAEYVATEALNYTSIGYELTWYDRMNNCLEDECRGCLGVSWNKLGVKWALIYAPFAFQ